MMVACKQTDIVYGKGVLDDEKTAPLTSKLPSNAEGKRIAA
jgi:hypothetical protein